MRKCSVISVILILCSGCMHDLGNQVIVEGDGVEEGEGRITAVYKLAAVESLAHSYSQGMRLMTVNSGEVNSDGTSARWEFEYVATASLPVTYHFHSTYDAVAFDSTSSLRVGAAIISHTWCNSDVALRIAEQNGGSQFRSQNPDCTIRAALGEPVVPNATTYWYITYRAKEDWSKTLSLTIDANTGTVTGKYS